MSAANPDTPLYPAADLAAEFDIMSLDAVPVAVPHGAHRSQDERIAALQEWLQPTDYLSPGSEYMKHLHAHVPGTGSWMHQSGDFKTWMRRSTETPCMHLKGVAGSGKSVLTASTIRHLEQLEPDIPVLFFFFRQIIEKNHSANYLIRDFAAQLLPYCPPLVQSLDNLSRATGVSGTEKAALWKAVAQALKDSPRAFCVVDALDEMDEDDFTFVTELIDLVTTKARGVRLLVTSRPLPNIEDALKSPSILRDKLDASLLYPDVATFVTVSMSTLQPSLSPETEDRVRDTICQRAQGLFLHARLMTEHLTEGLQDGRIREEDLPEKLENLPANLIEVYEQMLAEHAQRSGVHTEQQANILSCVIHATRPLRLIELGALIARLRGDDDLKEGKRLIRASCGRLLEILEDESVSVIHHSFTEFLQDKKREATQGSFPVLGMTTGHQMLVILSIQYLNGCPEVPASLTDPGTEEEDYERDDGRAHRKREERRKETMSNLKLEHPLLPYALDNLKHHLSHLTKTDEKVFRVLDDLLVPGKPAYDLHMVTSQYDRVFQGSNTLHLAALKGLLSYARHLTIAKPAWVNARDSPGSTPLSYAASKGHVRVAEILLQRGADPNLANYEGLSPLHMAISAGHVAVARLLLGDGVSPMIRQTQKSGTHGATYNKGKTALQYAMESTKTDMVCLFLPFVSPDEATEYFHAARDAESRDAILRTGHVAVDSYKKGKTALFEAAERHDVETMRILLKHGANPNARCVGKRWFSGPFPSDDSYPGGPTSIHAFVGIYNSRTFYSQEREDRAKECFQLLLDHGVDVHAIVETEDFRRLKALHFAVQNKSDSFTGGRFDSKCRTEICLAALLLSAGAKVSAKASGRRTALFFANPHGPEIVDLLVRHGADVNAVTRSGQTPLLSFVSRAATDNGFSTASLEKLLEYGADSKVCDNEGDHVFHYLFRHFQSLKDSHKPLLERLVNGGPGLNTCNKQNVAPLFRLRMGDAKEQRGLLQFLVDKGLDLDARGPNGHTKLRYCIDGRDDDALKRFRLFQELGANIKALDQNGDNLLHTAVENSLSEEWIRHLIFSGIDPTVKNRHGLNLVHIVLKGAVMDGNAFRTIEVLSEMGLSAAEAVPNGRTPLHIASLRQRSNDPARQRPDWMDAILENPLFGQPGINVGDEQGFTALHLAASMSEFNVGRLLKAGADPTILTLDGTTTLHVACRTKRPDVTSVLLARYRGLGILDQYINMRNHVSDGSLTALDYACRSGCMESVSLLLHYGADAAAVDGRGRTSLHILAEHCPKNRSEYALPEGLAWKETADIFDGVGAQTARDFRLGDISKIVQLLCSAGASLDTCTLNGMTAEDIARANSHHEVVRILSRGPVIDLAAEPSNNIERGDVVNALLNKEKDEIVPKDLFQAVQQHGHETILDYARAGGDIYILDEFGDTTVFHLLAEHGQGYHLRYFCIELKRVDAIARDRRMGQKRKTQSIERSGADVGDETEDKAGSLPEEDINDHDAGGPGTVLGAACRRERPNIEVIKVLVEEVGLDVNTSSHLRGYGYKIKKAAPIHILACGKHHWQIEALRYLLGKGAFIEALNARGQTPLQVAISSEWPSGFWKEETVRCLLEHGADHSSVLSHSSLAAIADSGDAGVMRALLDHGVDISRAPSALAAAVDASNIELVRLLLRSGAVAVNSRGYATGDKDEVCYDCRQRSGGLDSEAESKALCKDEKYLIHAATTHLPDNDPMEKIWLQKRDVIIAELLAHGADTSLTYDDGTSVLKRIIEDHGRVALVLKDIAQNDLERKGGGGRTLLMSACVASVPPHRSCYKNPKMPTVHLEAAAILLDAGACVDVVDDMGRTALHWLCTTTRPFDESHQRLFKRLIESEPSVVDRADRNGDTPLHLCLKHQQFWGAEILMEHVASFSGTTLEGNNMLHLIAGELIGDKNKASAAGMLFKKLVNVGVDVNARNHHGESPLFVFMSTPWTALPEHVSGRYMASTSVRDHALVHDVFHVDALPLFLDAGADLHMVSNDGSTLLHAVAGQRKLYDGFCSPQEKDSGGVFAKLLELGLDPRLEDGKMRSALDLAAAREWQDIMGLFSDEGREGVRKKWSRWERIG